MAIQYVRTMEINYGQKLNEQDFAKLNGALATKGVFLVDTFDAVNVDNYGFIEHIEETTVYGIVIDEEVIFDVSWKSDARVIVEGLRSIHPNITYNEVSTTVKTSKWAEPDGSRINFTIKLEGSPQNFDMWGYNEIHYDNGATMAVFLENSYSGMTLKFRVEWDCETVQRKEAIEEAMVQVVLNDMGLIQKTVEGRLKLKKFGYDVENVAIDCHFDAKTESRSECTPDIIKQVREARKGE